MTTLRAIASEIIRKVPGELWREEIVASLTTTTLVSSALAVGGWSNDKFASQFMWRPDTTTTADKVRYITAYTSSTGTLTHAGTNYADTTATSEYVIVSKIEPYIIRKAIDVAIQRTKTIDRTELPMVQGQGRYPLTLLDWIKSPSDIVRVCWDNSPVITRNRYLQKRNSVNSSGGFIPDFWQVSSNADTSPFTEPANWRGQKYYYNLQRSTTDATIQQSFHTLRDGVSGDYPAGETITAVCVTDPDTAGDVLLTLQDDTTTATSSGSGGGIQEITTSLTLSSTARILSLTATAQTNDASQPIWELYALVGDLNDNVRRDDYPEYELNRGQWDFDQNGVLTINFPRNGNGRWIIYSKRPYPGFDSTRLGSGAADADETDCPLQVAVAGALANIFLGINDPRYQFWENEYANQARNHIYGKNALNAQINFPLAPRARVF